MNLDASGSQPFLSCGNGAFSVTADGAITATTGTINGSMMVNGTLTAEKFIGNGMTEMYTLNGLLTLSIAQGDKLLVLCSPNSNTIVTLPKSSGSNVGSPVIISQYEGDSFSSAILADVFRGPYINPIILAATTASVEYGNYITRIGTVLNCSQFVLLPSPGTLTLCVYQNSGSNTWNRVDGYLDVAIIKYKR